MGDEGRGGGGGCALTTIFSGPVSGFLDPPLIFMFNPDTRVYSNFGGLPYYQVFFHNSILMSILNC